MATAAGCLGTVCTLVNCYRLMKVMSSLLPRKADRVTLWEPKVRDRIVVTLNFTGAHKRIEHFKAFSERAGNDFETVKGAYAASAAQQSRQQLRVYLVRAAEGPELVRGVYSVQTKPLGYGSQPKSEEVSECLQLTDLTHLRTICV